VSWNGSTVVLSIKDLILVWISSISVLIINLDCVVFFGVFRKLLPDMLLLFTLSIVLNNFYYGESLTFILLKSYDLKFMIVLLASFNFGVILADYDFDSSSNFIFYS